MNKNGFLTTLPDSTEIQQASFCWFLLTGLREELGRFPLVTNTLEFIELNFFGQYYKIKRPKYNEAESRYKSHTYAIKIFVPISVTILNCTSLEIWESNIATAFIGELPIITNRGTFIINGWERIIIFQISRCPGVYYEELPQKNDCLIYKATVIPHRGSWLQFELELISKKELTINIDNTNKLCAIEIFKALRIDLIKQLTNPIFTKYINRYKKKTVLLKKKQIFDFKLLFKTNIFNFINYDLGEIGRYQINKKFNLSTPISITELRFEDIFSILNGLGECATKKRKIDDIDHLSLKRVCLIGELLQNQFNCGLKNLGRLLVTELDELDLTSVNLSKLIDPSSLIHVISEFFSLSQLSQFLDQTNPLSELTHKRRISISNESNASSNTLSHLEIRDVHPSYYGRICPIDTPEGQRAGLVSSLSMYARINSFGFIETPFFPVKDGIILNKNEAIYLTADEEDRFTIAPADSYMNKKGKLLEKFITARYNQHFIRVLVNDIELVAVSPSQFFSVAISLIPFLEHDDATRVLMGANMMRQAVPLLYPAKPLIGTGFETHLATDTTMVIITSRNGYVSQFFSDSITIKNNNNTEITYFLVKYSRNNQNTCINYKPIIWAGENVESGQIIADGPGISEGEIALGQNVVIAYLAWEGYNFEDALLINERLLHSDLFTSVHIEQYDLDVKRTEFGVEKLTKNLPYVNKTAIQILDDNGIVYIGKFVKAGDILVGKITPNGNNPNLFQKNYEKSSNKNLFYYTENSLVVPAGSYGRILNTKIFSNMDQDKSDEDVLFTVQIFLAQIKKLQIGDKMAGRHGNKGIVSKILAREDMPYLPNGNSVDIILNPLGIPSRMNIGQLFEGLFGLSADLLDKRFKILPFDEMFQVDASRILINDSLKKAKVYSKNRWLFNSIFPGKIFLKDGRTGNTFENPITICKSYILKLVHLVEDKMHARSIGPYSLITQQPLKGKSNNGGQRFGEMEVWALEAYGTAYTLQELLTIKSDDLNHGETIFTAIANNQSIPKSGIPEAFKILIFELRSLGFDINTYKLKKDPKLMFKMVEVNIIKNFTENALKPAYTSVETY